MIELSKHIEMLLLENDCVVVPDLGGFIAHYQSARYVEDEGVFLPPFRTVGFNPQLTMNDGMLVQSYMQTHHTDFSDATRKIAAKVEEIHEHLYKEGMIALQGVGELYYNIRGEYEFHPQEKGILSPTLYGLDTLAMPLLADVEAKELRIEPEVIQPYTLPVQEKKEIRLNPHWLGHAVAVAVAAILFFVLSTPVENTYVDHGSYASLGTDCLFDDIRSQSMATTLVDVKGKHDIAVKAETSVKEEEPINDVQQQKHLKPVAVKVEKVLPAKEQKEEVKVVAPKPVEKPKKKIEKSQRVSTETSARPQKNYSIIVASLPTSADAQRMMRDYHQQGYADAKVVEGGGRFRIALYTYSDKAAAYKKLNSLKQKDAFKSAWMLSTK